MPLSAFAHNAGVAYETPGTGWAVPTFGSPRTLGRTDVGSALKAAAGRCPRCLRSLRFVLFRPPVDRFLVVCDEEGPVFPDQVMAEWLGDMWLLNPSGWRVGEEPAILDAASVNVTTEGIARWF